MSEVKVLYANAVGGWLLEADGKLIPVVRADEHERVEAQRDAYREALIHIGDRTSDGAAMRQARAALAEYEDGPDE